VENSPNEALELKDFKSLWIVGEKDDNLHKLSEGVEQFVFYSCFKLCCLFKIIHLKNASCRLNRSNERKKYQKVDLGLIMNVGRQNESYIVKQTEKLVKSTSKDYNLLALDFELA